MRQDSWLADYLDRHAFVVRHCNGCGRSYYSNVAFAAHLVEDHGHRELMLLRFLGRDSDDAVSEWLNDPSPRPEDP